AVLPANYTFTSTDNGSHTFTNGVVLKTAGNRSVNANDTVSGSVAGSATVTVNAGSPSKLAVTGPATAKAGTPFTVTISVRDAYGNATPGYTGTIHFTSSDPRAALPADYTFGSADQGSHSFTITFKTAGAQTLG